MLFFPAPSGASRSFEAEVHLLAHMFGRFHKNPRESLGQSFLKQGYKISFLDASHKAWHVEISGKTVVN
jgi:hypothetical protein